MVYGPKKQRCSGFRAHRFPVRQLQRYEAIAIPDAAKKYSKHARSGRGPTAQRHERPNRHSWMATFTPAAIFAQNGSDDAVFNLELDNQETGIHPFRADVQEQFVD